MIMFISVRTFLAAMALVSLGACEGAPSCPEQPTRPVVSYKFWTVFFEAGTTQLNSRSAQSLDDFAAKAKELDGAAIVETHTDRIGDQERNFALSYRRALALRDALVRRGVSGEKIVLTPRGDRQPIAPQPKGVADALNDRANLQLSDEAWAKASGPPAGYITTTMRCVRTEQLLVPVVAR